MDDPDFIRLLPPSDGNPGGQTMKRSLATLVVDDDEGVRNAVAGLLEIVCHEVEAVADIPRAIASLRGRTTDVAICDYMLQSDTIERLTMEPEFQGIPNRVLLTGHCPSEISSSVLEQFHHVISKTDERVCENRS